MGLAKDSTDFPRRDELLSPTPDLRGIAASISLMSAKWAPAQADQLSLKIAAGSLRGLAGADMLLSDSGNDLLVRLAIEVAIECGAHARRLRFSAPETSAQLLRVSRCVQLGLAGILNASLSTLGSDALARAIQGQCMHGIAAHAVQRQVSEMLLPMGRPLMHTARSVNTICEGIVLFAFFTLLLGPTLLVLPAFVLFPSLEKRLASDAERFVNDDEYATDSLTPLLYGGFRMIDPGVRLALYELSSVWLVVASVLYDVEQPTLPALGLVTAIGHLLEEARKLLRGGLLSRPLEALRGYAADEFALFDAGGLLLATLVLAARLTIWPGARAGDEAAVQSESTWLPRAMSVAVLLLALRPMRLFYLHSTLGLFMRMVFKMAGDVRNILVIGVPLVAAFASALHVLFKGLRLAADGEGCATFGSPEQQRELKEHLRVYWLDAFVLLTEVVVGGADAQLECLRQSEAAYLAWVLWRPSRLASPSCF
jgi:hypothetical protein